MKILNELKFLLRNKMKFLALLPIILMQFIFIPVPKVYAATSPSLGAAGSYSVLGHETVTCTGATTMSGDLGVYAGSAYTGFPDPCTVSPGTIHAGDANAALAQLANTAAFGTLDQTCDQTYTGTQDLVGLNLVPGVYCADAFALSGTLTLSGSGVWIFKSAANLITSGTANVVGGDPCNVWWREVSSATLGTNTSLIGNILASTSISLQTGASLNGRALAQTGAVTMDSNTISGPVCAAAPTPTPTPTSNSTTSTSTSTTNSAPAAPYCQPISDQIVASTLIESRRIDADSIFISWGPYSGTDKFNVRYGPANGNWLYNTDVTGFSTTINALPSNQPVWVQVAARSDCTIGTYGEAKLVGGGGGSRVLGASTDTLAATGSNDQFLRTIIAATAALFIFLLGKALLQGNETS